MKTAGILHAELGRQISLLGHTDRFVVADCGLPLPRRLPLVDLALCPGTVDLRTVLDAVLAETTIQAHVIAAEAVDGVAGEWFAQRRRLLGQQVVVSHEELKARLDGCVFAIRTGERTAYANVVCEAGVPF